MEGCQQTSEKQILCWGDAGAVLAKTEANQQQETGSGSNSEVIQCRAAQGEGSERRNESWPGLR